MSRNIYKLKKTSHLNNFLDLNYFKQSCCIFVSNKIIENKEFYKGLKKTLLVLSNENVYLSIYLINTDDLEDPEHLYSKLDKTKLHYMMFFRKTKLDEFDSDMFNFIPLISSKIITINDNYKAWLSKKNNGTDKEEHDHNNEHKENSDKESVKEVKNKKEVKQEDSDDDEEEEDDSESVQELMRELEKKKRMLENL